MTYSDAAALCKATAAMVNVSDGNLASVNTLDELLMVAERLLLETPPRFLFPGR
jgi:hypothetical protein